MRAVPIILVCPRFEPLGAFIRVGIGSGIGPLIERSLDEALGLAIGLPCVGLRPDVFKAKIAAGFPEGERFVAAAVVGHDAGDRDAEAGVVIDSGLQKCDGADGLFVGHHIGEGNA